MSALEGLWYPKRPERWWRRMALLPLWLLSLGWRLGTGLKRGVQRPRARRTSARVVSVGGLQIGGAGKTPVVIHLATWAAARGLRVAVLSRGYGRSSRDDRQVPPGGGETHAAEVGDEPLLIARRCPQAQVWVGADRARLAERVTAAGPVDVLLLDDGFQHWRLARDQDVVVLDAQTRFGNGYLVPRGPLREGPEALKRASCVWVRVEGQDAVDWPAVEGLPRVVARHGPGALLNPTGESLERSALRGRKVLAFAGLARPGTFFSTLQALGAELITPRAFADHHPFAPSELATLAAEAARRGAWLVTTEKDAVRLPAAFPAYTLRLDVEVLEGLGLMERLLLG